MIIQPYTPNYQAQVIDLILSIQCDELSVAIDLTDQPDLLEIPNFYQQNRGNFWIAINRDRVIGTIGLIDVGTSFGVLRKMFVQKDYRGKHIGVGQQLLETLLKWSAKQQFSQIYLGATNRYKAAHRFYEKNGFIEITTNQLPPQFPRMEVDTKFYCYHLKTQDQ